MPRPTRSFLIVISATLIAFTVYTLAAKIVVATIYEKELIEESDEILSQLISLPPKTDQSQSIYIFDEGVEVLVQDLTDQGIGTITLNGTVSSRDDLFYRYRDQGEEQQYKLASKLWLATVNERIKDPRASELIDFTIDKLDKKKKGIHKDPRHAYGTIAQKVFDPAKEADGLERISVSAIGPPSIVWFFDTEKVLSRLSPLGSAIHRFKGHDVWLVAPWTHDFIFSKYGSGIPYALSNLGLGIWLPILITAGLTFWFRRKGILLFMIILPVMFVTTGLAVWLAIWFALGGY